ncbi:MAG: hypothetical protein AMXMBFR7_10700 [Planctomycetota bacterium]
MSTSHVAIPAPPPQVLGGFELIKKLGRGAMGTVYLARQQTLDRLVALKVLAPHLAENEQLIGRFQREARASARLNHPHIVQGIDVGQDRESGLWYFAMEYVDGPTLWSVLKDAGRIPERRAAAIVLAIAQALECAEKNGIVHRDIKPDNILLTRLGEPKLADLGLAKVLADDATATQSGIAVGTPHYMAPEQVRGETDRLDVRCDIYALGCTFYHLLSGQTPFEGKAATLIMTQHLSAQPVPIRQLAPEVSDGCARVLGKMMEKSRRARFQSAAELVAALEQLLAPAAESPAQEPRRTPPSIRAVRGRPGRSAIRLEASSRRLPERVARREPEFRPPNLLRGIVTDLAVLVVVLGVLGGGAYYAYREGLLGFLHLPPPNLSKDAPREAPPQAPEAPAAKLPLPLPPLEIEPESVPAPEPIEFEKVDGK